MKNLFYIFSSVMVLLAFQSCKDNKKARNYNSKTLVDEEALTFIKQGLEGSLTEVKAAGIAMKSSTNQRVINFANIIVADHTNAGHELKKIEGDKYVMANDTINAMHKRMIANLQGKSGVDFDRAYIQMMIPEHEEAIKLYETVDHNTSGRIQAFAQKTLPLLKMHLDSAKAISTSLK